MGHTKELYQRDALTRITQQRDEERKKHEAAVTINERLLSDNRILTEQRDELLTALQWYADRYSSGNGKPTVAQAAIAKVQP